MELNPDLLKTACLRIDDLVVAKELGEQLLAFAKANNGIGLAANQVGLPHRVCVIDIPNGPELIFANPEITRKEHPALFPDEGCLSFPGQQVITIRYFQITVIDDFVPSGQTLTGLAAVAAYHEIDHLNGITMLERRLSAIGRNDPCPCDSGRKFKKCCQPLLGKAPR